MIQIHLNTAADGQDIKMEHAYDMTTGEKIAISYAKGDFWKEDYAGKVGCELNGQDTGKIVIAIDGKKIRMDEGDAEMMFLALREYFRGAIIKEYIITERV